MSKAKSTPNGKPYPDFPLTAHRASKQWCKKVLGKVHYFGKLDDWQAALAKWNEEKDYLLAGMDPPSRASGIDVGELCNRFLMWKRERMQSGELSAVTYAASYRRSLTMITNATVNASSAC